MKTQDYHGNTIETEQYGNNILLKVSCSQTIINKEIAEVLVIELIKNFDIKQQSTTPPPIGQLKKRR